MKMTVISHRPCWASPASPSGYAMRSGGSFLQIHSLSELFDATTVVVPCSPMRNQSIESPLTGHNLSVVPLTAPLGRGLHRKVGLPFWLICNSPILIRETLRADAVYAHIPGETGTIGMILAFTLRKPLMVRYGRNWLVQKTAGERLLKWFMERFASNRNIMLATGVGSKPPSQHNPHVHWIFSTTLTEEQLKACGNRLRQLSREQPRLIIVSRQEKEKGTGVVIESLPLILNDFPGLTLDVVGDGIKLTEFRELAITLGVSDHIIFHGKVYHSRVIELLQQADLFCLPTSHPEGFPRAVLEALACGLPVITTRVSVLPQLIGADCGLILEEITPAAIARGVRECLTDLERYRTMSAKAIETAREYSLERWRDTIGNLLQTAWGPLRSNG